MQLGPLNTRLAAAQLHNIFGVEPLFQRRGRTVSRLEDLRRLIFEPSNLDDNIYQALSRTTFRRTIALIANSSSPLSVDELKAEWGQGAISEEALKTILAKGVKLGIIVNRDGRYYLVRKADFGATLEWCIAYCFMNEFACPAFWGVEVEGLPSDYDVIVRRETQIGYIECKSKKLANISPDEIRNFLEREQVLSPSFSVFYADFCSRQSAGELAKKAASCKGEYVFEAPGLVDYGQLEIEEYKNFVRVMPINCFFAGSSKSLSVTFQEILRFLAMVSDRPMPYENRAVKDQFK